MGGAEQAESDGSGDRVVGGCDRPAPLVDRVQRLQEAGVDPTPGRGPKEAANFIATELAKWAPIIKASGAKVTN